MTTELIAILDGREMGRIVRDKRARLTFTYNEQWRRDRERLSTFDLYSPGSRAARPRQDRSVPLGVTSRQPDGARSMGQEIPCLGAERL
jgi:hypothetical protein